MEIKYTKDGKKVVVVGQINSTEYIVQEIYVTDNGDEIPSGEKFTIKSLLDSPLETYQSRKLKEQENRLKQLEDELVKIKDDISKAKEQQKVDAEWLKRNNFLKEKLPDFNWDHFIDVVTGNIQYVVRGGWQGLEIHGISRCEDYDKSHFSNNLKFEGLRVFDIRSIYNEERKEREYTFNVNRYRDGSGGSDECKFFTDIESLTKFVNDYYSVEKNVCKLTVDCLEKIEEFVKLSDSIKQKVIDKHNDIIEKQYQKMLNDCNKLLEKKL